MVVCTNLFMVMDSFSTVRRALASIGSVCSKNAVILFDFRNASNPLLRLKYKLAPLYDHTIIGHNLSTYYPSEIAGGLADAHMSIVDRKYIGLPFWRSLAPVIIIKARKI
jgi:hypothetical protein